MKFRIFSMLILGCVISLAGCRGGNTPDDLIRSANKSNLQRLANLYVMYQVQHKFQGPPSEAEFRAFLEKADAPALAKMGVQISELDDLFICERDGEPFKIKYGVPSGPRGSTEPVVFEAIGKGGYKMVGFLNMVQREVGESEYQQLWDSKVAPPPRNDDRSIDGVGRADGGRS
jgi:hypothetical protein